TASARTLLLAVASTNFLPLAFSPFRKSTTSSCRGNTPISIPASLASLLFNTDRPWSNQKNTTTIFHGCFLITLKKDSNSISVASKVPSISATNGRETESALIGELLEIHPPFTRQQSCQWYNPQNHGKPQGCNATNQCRSSSFHFRHTLQQQESIHNRLCSPQSTRNK